VRDHFLLFPMLVVLEGLGVLVPEIVVHNGVQPRSVEVHVFLGVLLVWHLCAGCLHNACSAKNFDLVNIKMFNGIAAARVDDSLVHLIGDCEVVDGVVQRGLCALRQAYSRADD